MKMFNKFKIRLFIILAFTTSLMPLNVFAVDKAFYSSNDILFYDPTDTNACASSTSVTSTGSIALEKSDALQHIFQVLVNGGMNAVQTAAVMGNMYGESSFNAGANEGGGGPGYGLVQWSFGRRTNLEAYAVSQGKSVSDVDIQLSFLLKEYNESYKGRLDKSDFATSSDVAAATTAWMKIFEAPAMRPANDPAGINSRRIPAAEKVYGFYSNLAPSPSSSTATTASFGCSAIGNGVIAGSIVKTAIGLAQPKPVNNGTTSLSQSTAAFQSAKAQYNPSPDPTDCGGFVSTVMKSSGVDPNYPNGTSVEYSYVQAHPEKYTVIHPKTTADLQPGDILVTADAGHTMVYVGADGGQYPAVDASLGQRIPSMREVGGVQYMLSKSDIIAARIIK